MLYTVFTSFYSFLFRAERETSNWKNQLKLNIHLNLRLRLWTSKNMYGSSFLCKLTLALLAPCFARTSLCLLIPRFARSLLASLTTRFPHYSLPSLLALLTTRFPHYSLRSLLASLKYISYFQIKISLDIQSLEWRFEWSNFDWFLQLLVSCSARNKNS